MIDMNEWITTGMISGIGVGQPESALCHVFGAPDDISVDCDPEVRVFGFIEVLIEQGQVIGIEYKFDDWRRAAFVSSRWALSLSEEIESLTNLVDYLDQQRVAYRLNDLSDYGAGQFSVVVPSGLRFLFCDQALLSLAVSLSTRY